VPLLVNLTRETQQLELGAHSAVLVRYGELRSEDCEPLLARHRHNRWIGANGEEFARLEIIGPLVVTTTSRKPLTLGP
jgi:hypothetical protein